MDYSYDDFLSAANGAGLMGEFSSYDLETAKKYPKFGMSILGLKQEYHDAKTPEQRLLINQAANELRKGYGNYTGLGDGGSFVSQGKIPGQIQDTLDAMTNFGAFSFDQSAPTYENQYAEYQQKLLDQILNREEFSWSKESDPLYSTYKKSYLREGDRAAQNAIAQASAASGGRPSSYAVTAASQAGDYYAGKLNDVIPTLYQQAYDKYLNEYSMMQQDLGAVNAQEQLDYQKYLDSLSQYNADRNFAYNQYLDDYSRLQSGLAALQSQDAVDYGRRMDQYNQNMERAELLAGAGDYSAYGALLGLTEEQTKALAEQYAKKQGLTDREAAMALADFYAGYGDYSKLKEMGVDTTYLKTLQQAELARAATQTAGTGSRSGGSSGTYRSGTGSVGQESADDAVSKFKAGDHSDAVIKAMLDMGYSQEEIELAGYKGSYFKKGGQGSQGGYGLEDLSAGSVLGLGIGPVSFATVESLVEDGKAEVYTDTSGKLAVRWATGYSAKKYRDEKAKTSSVPAPTAGTKKKNAQ